ncbi:MAG: PP2C family protein-serine/threonine phosphatase [Candidatus Aenigmatarchaeota archaeon]
MPERELLSKYIHTISSLIYTAEGKRAVKKIADAIYDEPLGRVKAVRVWYVGRKNLELLYNVGCTVPEKYEIPSDYEPVKVARDHGFTVMTSQDEKFNPTIEEPLGSTHYVLIDWPSDKILSLELNDGILRDDADKTLQLLARTLKFTVSKELVGDMFDVARNVQQSLLPQNIEFEGYDISWHSKPAKTVGGDFLFSRNKKENPETESDIIVIGDSIGKGLSASYDALRAVGYLEMGSRYTSEIVRIFEDMNSELSSNVRSGRFISAFGTKIENTGKIHYVNAGHCPPLLVKGDNIKPLEVGGLFLGAFPNIDYRTGTEILARNDTLLLYTDGLTEAMRKGNMYGDKRLMEMILKSKNMKAEDIMNALLEDHKTFRGKRQLEDDITLCVVKKL